MSPWFGLWVLFGARFMRSLLHAPGPDLAVIGAGLLTVALNGWWFVPVLVLFITLALFAPVLYYLLRAVAVGGVAMVHDPDDLAESGPYVSLWDYLTGNREEVSSGGSGGPAKP